MRKILSLLLTVLLLLSMTVAAFASTIPAEGSIWTPDDSSSGGGGGGSRRPAVEEDEECPQDETCPIAEYEDSDPKAWYHDGVHEALEEGLMNGVSDTAFAPDAPITRAMIVTILWRLEGKPEAAPCTFLDVEQGSWYADAVAWASENGIVTGYDEKTFAPMDPIAREQLAAILFRHAAYDGMETVTLEENLTSFEDADQVSAYAVSAMNWAVGEELINGIGGRLEPQSSATRAQAATILMRYRQK